MQPGANGCPTVFKRPQLAPDATTASHSNAANFGTFAGSATGATSQAKQTCRRPTPRTGRTLASGTGTGTAGHGDKRGETQLSLDRNDTSGACTRGGQAMSTEQISYYQAKLRYETDASDLFAALSAQENLVVIDARSREAFAKEHIPGAINIPHRSLSAETTAHLDKEASYVTYCDGIGCNASTKGAMRMAQLGFSVRELMGGLDWWRRDGFATQGENAAVGEAPSCGC